jgi:hypothetical protein
MEGPAEVFLCQDGQEGGQHDAAGTRCVQESALQKLSDTACTNPDSIRGCTTISSVVEVMPEAKS